MNIYCQFFVFPVFPYRKIFLVKHISDPFNVPIPKLPSKSLPLRNLTAYEFLSLIRGNLYSSSSSSLSMHKYRKFRRFCQLFFLGAILLSIFTHINLSSALNNIRYFFCCFLTSKITFRFFRYNII